MLVLPEVIEKVCKECNCTFYTRDKNRVICKECENELYSSKPKKY